jgi:hypothetical protein
MALAQILVGSALCAMAITGVGHGLVLLGAFALVVAFSSFELNSATQPG